MSSRRQRQRGRVIRQWITGRTIAAAMSTAPRVPACVVDWLQRMIAASGPHLPILSRVVAENMRAAGIYSPRAHRAYFAGVAQHLAGALHILRHSAMHMTEEELSREAGRHGMPPSLARVVHERVQIDATFDRLRQAAAEGKGVVLLAGHGVNFLMGVARINEEVPVTIYSRWSDNPRRRIAHRRWCHASGLPFIAEPPSAADPTRRAALMVEALQAGRVMVITPDLVQKREQGVPVRFLGREIYLPAGPAALSVLSGAPMVAIMSSPRPGGMCMHVHGPRSAEVAGKKRGWRQAAIQERMQWFVDVFTEFLRQHPQLWFLWGDKRWTRMFHGDPRYSRRLEVSEQPQPPAAAGVN